MTKQTQPHNRKTTLAPITITFPDVEPTSSAKETAYIRHIVKHQKDLSEILLEPQIERYIQQEFYWQGQQSGQALYYRPRDKVKGYAFYNVVCIIVDALKTDLVHLDDGGHKLVWRVLKSLGGEDGRLKAIKLGQSVYQPNQPRVVKVLGSNVENLWEKPLVKPLVELTLAGGEAKPFEDHILKNFQGDIAKQQWFIDWLAFQYQRPLDRLDHHCYLFHAEGGHGKGLLKKTLQQVMGRSAVVSIKNLNAFNDMSVQVDAVTKTLMVLEECPASLTDKQRNDIKTMTGSDTMDAARKYEGMRNWNITANFIFQSNNPPTMFDKHNDDRRWFVAKWHSVYDSSEAKDAYFNSYISWLESGGYEAIAAMLRDRDISSYDVAKKPLQTEELLKALGMTEDANVTLLHDYLEQHSDRPVFGKDELVNLFKGTKLNGNLNAIKYKIDEVGLVKHKGQMNIGKGVKISVYTREGIEIIKQQPRSILSPSGEELKPWLARIPNITDF